MPHYFSDPEKKKELYQLLYARQEMPFHRGEVAAQQKAGEELIALSNGKIISNRISATAAAFISSLPYAIASTQDREDRLWVSVLSFEEGFFGFPDERTLLLQTEKLCSNPLDDFSARLKDHPYMGLLFIDPFFRKRYRVNGRITFVGDHIRMAVEQAFVNCPKYIQKRECIRQKALPYSSLKQQGSRLNEDLKEWIGAADTFFVGSSDGEGKLDASHRGGKAGFVQVEDTQTLRIPDYVGNSVYNTRGNFMLHPKAALLFIDFHEHKSLLLMGTAKVDWSCPEEELESGTRRYWYFHISSWVLMENVKNLSSDFISYSPFNP